MKSLPRRRAAALVAAAALIAIAAAVVEGLRSFWQRPEAVVRLGARLAGVAPFPERGAEPCPWTVPRPAGARKPLVLLVLGQSNAGNHGGEALPHRPPATAGTASAVVTAFDGKACHRLGDPLPGGTGRDRSIWTLLEGELARLGEPREVVLSLLAVEGTTVAEWTHPGSPLRSELGRWLAARDARHFPADFVLWQQGEADAREGTSAARYVQGLEALREQLRGAGVRAPILLARSTRCRSGAGGAVIRAAQDALIARHADVRAGADTDALAGPLRQDDCHFTAAGLQAAARAWGAVLAASLPG
ncbi:MAG: hypothetical protein JNL85_14775 [Rubrivivax sp.]|nr:hypothetical protein [Rubrivivax sp.]